MKKNDPMRILKKLLLEEKRQSETGCIAKPSDLNHVANPLESIKLIAYPPGSTEHPFDPYAKGKYFVHVANRKTTISYLGEHFEYFEMENHDLHKAIPMGYSTLWVMQRIFMIDKTLNEYYWDWKIEDRDPYYEKTFCLLEPRGALRFPDIIARVWNKQDTRIQFKTYEEAVEFSRKAIAECDYPIVCGMMVASYYWH